MHFLYDAQGRPMLVRYMDVDFACLHNLQENIASIEDISGTTVVEYGYDAWGKPVTTEGSMAGTLGKDNPFRYRGYVWDEETGLYYLRSRYYDPSWGRFVNADTVLGKTRLLGVNLYCNCRNSPLLYSDPEGMRPADPEEAKAYFETMRGARKYPAPPHRSSTVLRQPNDFIRALMVDKMDYVALGFALAGWYYASNWLSSALHGKGDDLYYASDSELAQQIAHSSEVLGKVSAFASGNRENPVLIEFESGDLFYAIHFASLYMSKDASGRLSGTLYDYYDYAKAPGNGPTAILVNEAYDLQQSGYLYTYNIYISLDFN